MEAASAKLLKLPGSKLVTSADDLNLISEGLDPSLESRYEMKLLMRASDDGFGSSNYK